MKKPSSKTKKPHRRKLTAAQQAAKGQKREHRQTMNAYNKIAENYDTVVGMHITAVEVLRGIVPLADIIDSEDVKTNITPKVKTELMHSVKVLADMVQHSRNALAEHKESLEKLRPDPSNVPDGDDALFANLEIMTQGTKYSQWVNDFELTVLPAARTCLDLVNTCLPDDKKHDLSEFDTLDIFNTSSETQPEETVANDGAQ